MVHDACEEDRLKSFLIFFPSLAKSSALGCPTKHHGEKLLKIKINIFTKKDKKIIIIVVSFGKMVNNE